MPCQRLSECVPIEGSVLADNNLACHVVQRDKESVAGQAASVVVKGLGKKTVVSTVHRSRWRVYATHNRDEEKTVTLTLGNLWRPRG